MAVVRVRVGKKVFRFDAEYLRALLRGAYEEQAQECGFLVVPAASLFRRAAGNVVVRPHEMQPIADFFGLRGLAGAVEYIRAALESGHLRYESDGGPRDRWQTPRTTIARGAGDCEDLAAVAVSLMQALGVDARLAIGTLDGEGHAFVVGMQRGRPFLFEATNGEFFRGMPPEYAISFVCD